MKTNDVIGLGNALMDFLVRVEDYQLPELNLNKGETVFASEEKAKDILNRMQQNNLNMETVPGGCSANTIKGIATLGGNAILCGKVGDDSHGESYVQQMQDHGVSTRISKYNLITGHALTFITPDSERTFSVHLGASTSLVKDDILEEDIVQSKVLYLEGFQLEGPTKETVLHAVELAKKHDTKVAIDLNDAGLIRRNKEFLKDFLRDSVDMVFLNEGEVKEFTGLSEEEGIKEVARGVNTVIVKLGKEGSIISHNDQITKVNSYSANPVDTTGAGDTYAAGFLYGYCNNWSIEKSGKLGSLAAARIVEKIGVRINELNVEELKRMINKSP